MKILVVDDFATIRHIVANMLAGLGHVDVDTVKNGKVAADMLLGAKYDLVISDVSMPVMDGIQLLKFIRSHENLKDTPVIIMTAVANQDDIEMPQQAGASAVILKPFTSEMLDEKIALVVTSIKK